MKGLCKLLLYCLLVFTSCRNKNTGNPPLPADGNIHIRIPASWIEKVYNYDPNTDVENDHEIAEALIEEFEHHITPDSVYGSKARSEYSYGIFNPIFTNLDSEPGEELICIIAWTESYPLLAVFKQMNKQWYLVYKEHYYMFYTQPDMYVANNFSRNKIFYFRALYNRGSGVYCDAYNFYKLINNKVYHCLEVINKAHIDGWHLYLNQQISSEFTFNSTESDAVEVTYNYSFYPNLYNDSIPADVTFVDDIKTVLYRWNDSAYAYLPLVNNDSTDLNSDKISCFKALGNDSLFVHAFKHELMHVLKNGTPGQKKVLHNYLNLVDSSGRKVNAAYRLKEKVKIGDLIFYGPPDKLSFPTHDTPATLQ